MPASPQDFWEQIGQSARVAICAFNADYRLIAFNTAHNAEFFRVNGYYTKIGDVFPELFVPEQAVVMRGLMARALTGEIFSVTEEFGNPVLDHPCWEISYAPLRDEAGEIVGAFHVALDVGPRLRAEAAMSASKTLEEQVAASTKELQENRARLRTIFETSFSLQALLTKNGILIDANATSLAAIGSPLKSIVGTPFWETPWFATTPGMTDLVRDLIPQIASGAVIRREMHVDLPVGGWRWFDVVMRPIRSDAGEVVALAAEAIETTERRRVEDALRQSQKMEAIGQLTGGIAHDFNNLLAVISGSLELLDCRLAQGRLTDLDRFSRAAQEAARRAAALTHRLLAFSRRQTLDPRPTGMNQLIAGMDELIRRTVGPAIAVEMVDADELWQTLVDPPQLENALLNLCINARDAMPDGGRITIETGNRWLDEGGARDLDLVAGQYVSLSVSDTGHGMPPEVIAKAFDPFFTTKPLGQGTGLGLSMIYGFARQSGGQVRIHSEVGTGSTVSLYLPRHHGTQDEAETGGGEPALAETPRAEGETVLVVDDEPAVRMLVMEVLDDLGCIAIEAEDGPSALKIIQSGARIDLLVTDVGLPGGMNGRQVADASRAQRPGLKVLFITGYAENAVIREGHLQPGMSVMTKPFSVIDIAGRIRMLIGENA